MNCYLLLCLFSFVFPSYSGCNVKRYICTHNSSVYTIQTFGQQRSERQVNIGSKTWQGWTKSTFPKMFKPSVFDCTYFHLRTLWILCTRTDGRTNAHTLAQTHARRPACTNTRTCRCRSERKHEQCFKILRLYHLRYRYYRFKYVETTPYSLADTLDPNMRVCLAKSWDGVCDWCFTSFSTIFQSYHDCDCVLHETR